MGLWTQKGVGYKKQDGLKKFEKGSGTFLSFFLKLSSLRTVLFFFCTNCSLLFFFLAKTDSKRKQNREPSN